MNRSLAVIAAAALCSCTDHSENIPAPELQTQPDQEYRVLHTPINDGVVEWQVHRDVYLTICHYCSTLREEVDRLDFCTLLDTDGDARITCLEGSDEFLREAYELVRGD